MLVPIRPGDFKNPFCLSLQIAFLWLLFFTTAFAKEGDVETLLHLMRTAYSAVDDYQAMTTVRIFKNDGAVDERKFLYSFKKPHHVRMDFLTPHSGAILFYPDDDGRVVVRLAGIAGIFPLHLSVNNPRLVLFGQRIDQTDIGLLIENISRSVGSSRRGPVSITEDGDITHVVVLALDHFTKDTETLYRFSVDRASSLPVEVEESTPDRLLRRTVTLKDLQINRGLSDRFMAGERER
jgi:outer membrane lipoprotein-sorting protein